MRIFALAAAIGFGSLVCGLSAQSMHTPTPPMLLNHNLVKNGNAEAPGQDEKHVPAWGEREGFTGVRYGSVGGEWDWGLSGCAGCGGRYLRLQFEAETHELSVSQVVDISSLSADIDKKLLSASVSAYLGGFLNGDTTGTVTASFQDASGAELGRIETTPYDTKLLPKAERGSTGLVECKASGAVPAGTRKIIYTWKARATGDSGDYLGLGDNFSLVLAKPPTA
jgi:hypothetical protein